VASEVESKGIGAGEMVGVKTEARGRVDIFRRIVHEKGLVSFQPKAPKRQGVDSRLGLPHPLPPRNHNIPEPAQKSVSRRIGDARDLLWLVAARPDAAS
jgi:hypothetical protein